MVPTKPISNIESPGTLYKSALPGIHLVLFGQNKSQNAVTFLEELADVGGRRMDDTSAAWRRWPRGPFTWPPRPPTSIEELQR